MPGDHGELEYQPLLERIVDLARKHPLPLLAPLVLLGLLTAGGNGGPGGDPWGSARGEPWFLFPFFIVLGIFVALVALAILALLVVLNTLAWLVTTSAAHTADAEASPDLGHAFREAKPRLVPGILTGLLVALILLVGFVLLVVPGIFLAAALSPWASVVLKEGKSGPDAIRRAWDLTDGHRLPLFLLVGTGFLAAIAAGLVLGWIPIVGDALAGIAAGIALALTAVLGAVVYDRRTRPPTPVLPAP